MELTPANPLLHARSAQSSSQQPISFARLNSCTDLLGLQAELTAVLQKNWVDHVNQQDYRGGWDVLPLRCQSCHVDAHPILQGFSIAACDEWQDLPILDACPTIKKFLVDLACPLKAVRLMRLKAGAVIKPHRDAGLAIEYGEARLHLPIQTSNDILFFVNNQPVPMRAGELWYINADQEHAVHNRGIDDRINLVIDCSANDWLVGQIKSANFKVADAISAADVTTKDC